jgi:hypothetical protein
MPLILKRASVSRRSDQWRDEDYGVLENGGVVGRIFFLDAVGPPGRPLMWHNGDIKRAATATRRPARPRWPHSPRAGGGGNAPVGTAGVSPARRGGGNAWCVRAAGDAGETLVRSTPIFGTS